jgi:chemotaxis response regulator CheB
LCEKPTSKSQPREAQAPIRRECGDSETSPLQIRRQESRGWERLRQRSAPHPMSKGAYRLAVRDIIVVGCSVGGVEALQKVVGGLPAGFPGSLFVGTRADEDGAGRIVAEAAG